MSCSVVWWSCSLIECRGVWGVGRGVVQCGYCSVCVCVTYCRVVVVDTVVVVVRKCSEVWWSVVSPNGV